MSVKADTVPYTASMLLSRGENHESEVE